MTIKRGSSFAILLSLALAGCSNFETRWKEPLAVPPSTSFPLAGKWEGTWFSTGGHGSGDLRAIIVDAAPVSTFGTSPSNATTRQFAATFKSTYWALFSASFTVQITASLAPDGRCVFHGTKDLGFFAGGNYTYDGSVNATDLNSTYTASADHGDFRLRRVP